jgi:hypothetical protein
MTTHKSHKRLTHVLGMSNAHAVAVVFDEIQPVLIVEYEYAKFVCYEYEYLGLRQ